MTAIVDKKALRTLLSLKAIARSRCQTQTAATVWSIAAEAAANTKARGLAHAKTLREIPVPVRLCATFGVRSRNCRTASDSLPLARATTQCGTGFQPRR